MLDIPPIKLRWGLNRRFAQKSLSFARSRMETMGTVLLVAPYVPQARRGNWEIQASGFLQITLSSACRPSPLTALSARSRAQGISSGSSTRSA